jgi:hypothetical protein
VLGEALQNLLSADGSEKEKVASLPFLLEARRLLTQKHRKPRKRTIPKNLITLS